jgi:hypothetical protein
MAAAGRPGDVIEFFMGEVVGVPPADLLMKCGFSVAFGAA